MAPKPRELSWDTQTFSLQPWKSKYPWTERVQLYLSRRGGGRKDGGNVTYILCSAFCEAFLRGGSTFFPQAVTLTLVLQTQRSSKAAISVTFLKHPNCCSLSLSCWQRTRQSGKGVQRKGEWNSLWALFNKQKDTSEAKVHLARGKISL